ncbi:KilA-N domain-containing protein [Ferrovibrio sp.]|uniref:KilA-N domain-containing protein n=1 Tax=Ferrovibrio sp. TaxID=1917215 RepID=UPI00311FDD6B
MSKDKNMVEPIPDTMGNVVKTLVRVPPPPPKGQPDERQGTLPLIAHQVESISVDQRAHDGYVNATALCQASGKMLGHYLETKATQAFLTELSADIGIPISELVQIVKGGPPQMQGTWVHPQVAINLGQWASPKFAVLVSKWVFEWMSGGIRESYKFPYHIRRYLINRGKIPSTHFSMLDQMTFKLLGALEAKGYVIPANLMPDISLGKIFSGWLREKGHDPDSFPTYQHDFDDGRRPVVNARLYPNELMTEFNEQLDNWIKSGRALQYFKDRDAKAIEPIKQVYAELVGPEKLKEIEGQ